MPPALEENFYLIANSLITYDTTCWVIIDQGIQISARIPNKLNRLLNLDTARISAGKSGY